MRDKFTADDVRGVLIAAGYTVEQMVKFMAEVKDWFILWQEFEKRAYAAMSTGAQIKGLRIIEEIKANHNYQPYFCAMFNGKYRRDYFRTREKNNKSKHYEVAA